MNLNINKKAILVVSFGTSYNDTREKTIGAIERKIADEFPEFDIRRAFTSKIIINILKERDNLKIDNVTEAMNKLFEEGYGFVIIHPTHVMNGEEYEGLLKAAEPFNDKFLKIEYGQPLLTSSDDFKESVVVIAESVPEIKDEKTAVVFMGHGTEHYADAAYAALDYRFKAMGYSNVYVGTVEGYPDTKQVVNFVDAGSYKRVVLYPFMIAAGDHANNDMAGEEAGSWKTEFEKRGYKVSCMIRGLGEYAGIQNMFINHIKRAISD